jgi:hypothetical protein
MFLLLLTLAANAEVIDRVAASVDEQLITASEVALEADLARIDASPVPFWNRGHGDALHRLVDAAVIRELAGDVALYQPSDDAIGVRLDAMRAKFPDRAAWGAFLGERGLDEDTLRALIGRRMVVEAYLLRNIAVPPANTEPFLDKVEGLVEPAKARMRIREIPEQAG